MAVNVLLLVLRLRDRWSVINTCPLIGKPSSQPTDRIRYFPRASRFHKPYFPRRFIIKLFMHLETGKQMRLRNPFTPSYSRATSAVSAL